VFCSVFTGDLTTLLCCWFHPQESLPVVAENGVTMAGNDGDSRLFVDLEPVPAISKRHGGSVGGDHAAPCARARTMSTSFKEPPCVAEHLPLSGPVQLAASTGFSWAKKPRPDATTAAVTVTMRSGSMGPGTNRNNNSGGGDGARTTSGSGATATATAAAAPYEAEKQEVIKQWAQVADAFSASEAYNSRLRQTLDAKQLKTGMVSLSQLTITSTANLQSSAVSLIISRYRVLDFVTLMDNL
jgi:hypothetical protein